MQYFNNNHHSCVPLSGKCWLLLSSFIYFQLVPALNSMSQEMVEWQRRPSPRWRQTWTFPPFLKHNCVVKTWTMTGCDSSCRRLSPTAVCDGYVTWWARRWGSVRRPRLSTFSSSQHNCNTLLLLLLDACVYACNKSVDLPPGGLQQSGLYSSVASFLLVSCPSKIGYLLSTSAQLSEPLAKSRTITGSSLTWYDGNKEQIQTLCSEWHSGDQLSMYFSNVKARQKVKQRTSALICLMESRSLRVAVWGVLFTVSKSMVMPKATPISSVRA